MDSESHGAGSVSGPGPMGSGLARTLMVGGFRVNSLEPRVVEGFAPGRGSCADGRWAGRCHRDTARRLTEHALDGTQRPSTPSPVGLDGGRRAAESRDRARPRPQTSRLPLGTTTDWRPC